MSDATFRLIIENIVPLTTAFGIAISALGSAIAVVLGALNRKDIKDTKQSLQVVDEKAQAAVDLTKQGNDAIGAGIAAIDEIHQVVAAGVVANAGIADRVANLEAGRNG